MKHILYLLLLFCTTSCSKYFYRIKYSNENSFTKGSTITLDPTFQYYIRKVYKTGVSESKKNFGSNLKLTGSQENLIEIEYLLISSKGPVIYLTMMQDRKQQFYAKHYLGDQFINAYEFKNLLFGTIADSIATFESKDNILTTDEWLLGFTTNRDTVFIQNILETVKGGFEQSIPVERALAKKVGFVKIQPPALVFHEPKYPSTEHILFSADNKLNFYSPGKHWRIHFVFQDQPENLTIYYQANRAPYRPDKLFDQ